MQIYIAVPPESVAPEGFTPAHIIYRAQGAKLYLARGHRSTRGGVAVVSVTQTGGAPTDSLVDELAFECEKREFTGIVFDTGNLATPILAQMARAIAAAIAPRTLFVTETLGANVPEAVVLVQTALSGGYLSRHLEEALRLYGVNRVAAEVDRVLMDFTLPAYAGTGATITREQSETLRTGRTVHYSDALCVKYYMHTGDGVRHIVLTDDAETVTRKLALASSLGINHAFLYLPHVADVLPDVVFPARE